MLPPCRSAPVCSVVAMSGGSLSARGRPRTNGLSRCRLPVSLHRRHRKISRLLPAAIGASLADAGRRRCAVDQRWRQAAYGKKSRPMHQRGDETRARPRPQPASIPKDLSDRSRDPRSRTCRYRSAPPRARRLSDDAAVLQPWPSHRCRPPAQCSDRVDPRRRMPRSGARAGRERPVRRRQIGHLR